MTKTSSESELYTVSQKADHFYLYDNFRQRTNFHFFTVKFRKAPWRKLELKLPSP